MAAPQWDTTSVKAQLRLTSQRLGQLQEKKDSRGSITKRDIATLLQQGNIGLARQKAQNVLQDDALGDVLELLEMHIGVILEHISEIDQSVSPSPVVVEAASSIIFAAPRVDSRDLQNVRDLLVHWLGPDFVRSAIGNRDHCVPSSIVNALSAPPASAAQLDAFLIHIARTYGVSWAPEPRRQDILNALSEILNPESAPAVDMAALQRLCAQGIPDEPAWLRPRLWKLFLGILPVLKASWHKSITQQRESYYDLVRRLSEPFAGLPPPATPLSALDSSLLDVSKQLSRIPPSLFVGLEDAPELTDLCPLDDKAPDGIRIHGHNNLDVRMQAIQETMSPRSSSPAIPEIRLEFEESSGRLGTCDTETSSKDSTVLVASKSYVSAHIHDRHASALLRILYLHKSINPGNLSPHVPALLLPLYTILNQEIEAEDLAHVEADTFWVFEAVIGEFSELEDEEGGNLWMKKFSERLAWADYDLRDNLFAKGLDPSLPHYSYRWLAPLLTQTLPLPSVCVVWDALFSRPMRQRENYKLEYLVDICTAMLLCAKTALYRLGKSSSKPSGLWTEVMEPPSPLRPWELGDAFVQGMALLQHYPIESAGGIDLILQTASDLRHRREDEARVTLPSNLSLGDRLRISMWKGFTNQTASPERSPSPSELSSDDDGTSREGNETETQANTSTGLTSRLATTVWRGITNQAAMEPPPSPLTPLTSALPPSPASSSSRSPLLSPSTPLDKPAEAAASSRTLATNTIWSYAEKLKDSDAAATLAKVSSNWRARALMNPWGARKNDANLMDMSDNRGQPEPVRNSVPLFGSSKTTTSSVRRDSVPEMDRSGLYSPPERPTYFRPPRDTVMFIRSEAEGYRSSSPELSPRSESGFKRRTMNLQASLAALTGFEAPQPPRATPKTGPRPLLLNSSSLMTSSNRDRPLSRSQNSTPIADNQNANSQWNDVMKARSRALHRDSQSSISSLSPSDALARVEWDSDTPSRKVPLNRRSVSPMAPYSRISSVPHSPHRPHSRAGSTPFLSTSSSGSSSIPLSSPVTTKEMGQVSLNSPGWGQVDIPDSPPSNSPSAPKTPLSPSFNHGSVRITDPEETRGSVVLTDTNVLPLEPPTQSRKLTRKRTPPSSQHRLGDTSDSSVAELPSRSPRIRSKRHPLRPTNLRIQDSGRPRIAAEQSPDTLSVDWPQDGQDVATTPKAANFDSEIQSSASPISPKSPRRSRKVSADGSDRPRKASGEGHDVRTRKISTESRTRKSSDTRTRRKRESAAEEGDDEGYDDLLSAYESEDGLKSFARS